MPEGRKLAAILAADVAGYSRLAGVDEELILARLRTLRSDLIDPTIAVHGGRVVNRTGDGVLVEFRSVVDAVRCAIEIQLGMAERNTGLPPDKRIEYRVGVHLGDVVEESDGDLMGDGVNIAARLEGIARPGAICLSEQAYWQVKGRLDLAVMDLGRTHLKNIAEPVHVYSLEAGAAARAKRLKGAARRQGSLIIALAALVVMLAVIGAGVWHFRSTARIEANAERTAILVLPFANPSGYSTMNQLAEAVTDGLTDAFSRLAASFPFFQVIAGEAAKTYAGKPIDVKQIGKDLGLRYVVQGSMQPAEMRVRVSAQLIDAENGAELWAETFDEDRAPPLQMEDEIVAQLARALELRVAEIEMRRASTARPRNPGAQDLAFRCAVGATNFEAVDPRKRAALLEPCDEALRLDPHNPVALGNRASLLLDGVDRGQSADRAGDLKRAKDDVTTLLAMNADDSFAHGLNAFRLRLEGQPAQAVAEGERSVALNPSWAVPYFFLCPSYRQAGQPEKAVECVDKAIRLSPHDPSLWGLFLTKAGALDALGRDSEALDWVRRSLALAPENEAAQRSEMVILEKLGRDDEAREAYQRYSARPGVPYFSLCQFYLDSDQPERAMDCVDKMSRSSLPDPSLSALFLTKGGALLVLGRVSEGLDWVRRSLALVPENQTAQLLEIAFLEILGRAAEAHEAYERYIARPGTSMRTIADVRARAAPSSPALKAAFEQAMEALRNAGMPEK